MAFAFGTVYVIDYVYGFSYVKLALHPRDEPDLIVKDKVSDVLMNLVSQYFIEDFDINVHHG